jgi:hypothetical protein
MSSDSAQLVIATAGAIATTAMGLGPQIGWTAGPAMGLPLMPSTPDRTDDKAEAADE